MTPSDAAPPRRIERGRALRLLCPWCGGGPLFLGWFRMAERCRGCGLRFEREPGYWLGSIYVSYGVALAVALAVHLTLQFGLHASAVVQIVATVGILALFSLWFHRYGRALWLAFDLRFDPPRPEELADGGPPDGTTRPGAPGPI